MRRFSRRSRWLAALRNLLLGLLLGGLQLLLMGEMLSFWHWHFPWWLYVGIGALFYLLIPGFAGFLAAQRTGDENTGVGAGCLVGFISIFIAFTTFWVVTIYLTPDQPSPPLRGPPYPIDTHISSALPMLMILFEGMGGTIAAVLGSSIGEAWGLSRYVEHYYSREKRGG